MQRILLAIGGAAAFCAGVTFLLQIAIARGLPAADIVLVTSSATLLLSLGAAALAYRAFNRARLLTHELERLTRSMDAAIKDLSVRGDRDATRLDDLNALVTLKLSAPTKHKADDGVPTEDASTEATSRRSSPRKGKPAQLPASEPAEASGVDVAIRRMVAGGQADLSLQPIIAPGRGEAGGFEVHFHIEPEEGKPVDIRRLEGHVADVRPAAFERLAMVSAAEAIRRGLGDISERKPLHVAVSDALLDDKMELAAVLDTFKLHPSLARSIVVSMPEDLLQSTEHTEVFGQLSGLGIRLAAEDWPGSLDELETVKGSGAGMVKVAADRLLDRAKTRKGAPNGAAIVEMAEKARIDVIATDVQSEEDAVSLIDMGIDLMTGDRLSAPRRLEA
ncbi:EAL domain-containing protein [Mesorhizobium marinum]|uniref:EAL domain-containing protein n=1 Tax=Mesorhizobium marinum TaxID=3228790 RepID=UPI003464EE4B